MNFQIGYDEISSYALSHYNKNVSIEYIDPYTATIKVSIKVLLVPLTVPLTIRIDSVESDTITLTYSGKLGIDKIVSGVICFLTNNVEDINKLLNVEGQTLTIHLSAIKNLRTSLDHISLSSIRFGQDCIEVAASLK